MKGKGRTASPEESIESDLPVFAKNETKAKATTEKIVPSVEKDTSSPSVPTKKTSIEKENPPSSSSKTPPTIQDFRIFYMGINGLTDEDMKNGEIMAECYDFFLTVKAKYV